MNVGIIKKYKMNIVISGAGKGIGYSLTRKFLEDKQQNNTVFALSRNINQLNKLKEIYENLYPLQCDITNLSQLESARAVINLKCQSIDYLINNAGALINKSFLDTESAEIDYVFNVNFKAPFLLIQKLFNLLALSENAHVVNISSMGGFQGSIKFPGLSVYSSSKAALVCLTECLTEEFKGTDIKFNVLCLGSVETEMLSQAFPNYKAPTTADQMAEFIMQFTYNNNRFMNGMVIPVALSTP